MTLPELLFDETYTAPPVCTESGCDLSTILTAHKEQVVNDCKNFNTFVADHPELFTQVTSDLYHSLCEIATDKSGRDMDEMIREHPILAKYGIGEMQALLRNIKVAMSQNGAGQMQASIENLQTIMSQGAFPKYDMHDIQSILGSLQAQASPEALAKLSMGNIPGVENIPGIGNIQDLLANLKNVPLHNVPHKETPHPSQEPDMDMGEQEGAITDMQHETVESGIMTQQYLEACTQIDNLGFSQAETEAIKQGLLHEFDRFAQATPEVQQAILAEYAPQEAVEEGGLFGKIWNSIFGAKEAEAFAPALVAGGEAVVAGVRLCLANPVCRQIVATGLSTLQAAVLGEDVDLTQNVLEKSEDKINDDNDDAQLKETSPASPDPDWDPDWEPDNDKFKWEVKDPKDADKIMRHERFGKFYRDPEQKLGNKELWWSKDNAGHGGARYKLFIEHKTELEWIADLDEFGNVMTKHKSPTGEIISKKNLIGIK